MNPQINKFFGIKVSKTGIPVQNASDKQLTYKNDFSTQTFYTNSGAISFGVTSDNDLGMETIDSDGFTLFKMDGQTWFWFDKNTGKNVMQVGLLPDGTYGWAVATEGNDIRDSF